jgi:hypothetical protein
MKSFFSETRAVVTIEFAFLAPICILIIAISLETARIQVARLLIQRAIYDLSYNIKISSDRNIKFDVLTKQLLEKWSNSIFRVEDIQVEIFYNSNLNDLLSEKIQGAGNDNDVVLLRFTANFGIFSNLVSNPNVISQVFDFYYINEPQLTVEP